MRTATRRAAALTAVLFLAACGGGGRTTATLPAPGKAGTVGPATKLRIVGVGDSLTAGVQSGGLMGSDLPIQGSSPSLGQIGPVQRTQEYGFYSILWQQANGVNLAFMSDPTQSPLPLMTPPGVGDLLAPTTAGFPYPITTYCDSFQIPANNFSTALTLRENGALNPSDVAIPGQTVHEALYMTGALGNCSVNQSSPAQFIALNALVNGESQNFWPILAGFGNGVTQVQAAVSLHGQVATVWLGSNDLLKVAFSGGAAPVTSPASMQADIGSIVQQLKKSGAKVIVANLVDVMGAAVFIPQPAYEPTLAAYLTAALEANSVPNAATIADEYAAAYAAQEGTQTGVGANGYYTISALFASLQAAVAQIEAQQAPVAPTLVTGDFVVDALAAEIKSLNTSYNTAIAAAASQNGAALADIHTAFVTIEQNGGLPINPPACCSLVYGGGFFSLDGVHPSNTGYAVIANVFIDALDAAYNLGIPEVSVPTVYATDPYAPGNGVSSIHRVVPSAAVRRR